MKQLLIIVFLLNVGHLMAQHTGFQSRGISTNPDNPINPDKASKKNTFFDWRTAFYNLSSSAISGTQISSPFDQSDNPNLPFLNNKDRLPQDGWELIKYDLGFREDGTPKSTQTNTVYLVLYNKYTGALRVFAAGAGLGYNGAEVVVSFNSSGTRTMSSILSNASEIMALDRFEANPIIKSVSKYINDSGKWLYADFNMTYDPCTSLYESELNISINLIDESEITISGSVEGTLTDINSNSSGGSVTKNGYSFGDYLSRGQKSKKTFETLQDFSGDIIKAIDFVESTSTEEKEEKKESVGKLMAAIQKAKFLKSGLQTAPYIGTAVEVFDFLIAGGTKSSPQNVTVMPMAINATVHLQGSLVSNQNYGNIQFYTPGSYRSEIKDAQNYPYYNEILGVFNLLKTPVIQTQPIGIEPRRPSAYRHRITPIDFVLNPAAGFRNDKVEILAALEYLDGASTSFLPLECISSMTFNWISDVKNLKLLINLERTDADATTQNVLLSYKFPVSSSTNYSLEDMPSYHDIAEKRTLNGVISTNASAWESITVNEGATFSGNITLTAPRIIVKNGVTIPSNVRLVSNTPFGCTTTYSIPVTSASSLNNFCNSSLYKRAARNQVSNGRTASVDETAELENLKNNIEDLNIFPNPSSSSFNITATVEIELIEVLDLSGRLIKSMDKPGKSTQLDMRSYKAGVYMLRMVKVDGSIVTTRIVRE